MNRANLQALSRLRRKEARTLLRAKQYCGAYYLAGYSIECAIKACVARQTKRYEFPDKALANKAWSHDLESLMGAAGLTNQLKDDGMTNRNLQLNWAVVKDWNESSRYAITISRTQVEDFFAACFARNGGILSWVKQRW